MTSSHRRRDAPVAAAVLHNNEPPAMSNPAEEKPRFDIKKIAVGVVAAGLAIVAFAYYKRTSSAVDSALQNRRVSYVYDLTDGSVKSLPVGKVPPFDLPDKKAPDGGPAGVVAAVFSCTDCQNPSARFVGYLINNSPELKAAINQATEGSLDGETPPGFDTENADLIAAGRLVASPDTKPFKWVPMDSPEGTEIMEAAAKKCSEGVPLPCAP